MEKRKKRKKYLLFGGLILIALSLAVGALLLSLSHEELCRWYVEAQQKLAELEKAGKLRAVVTQNIDGLHQAAGSKKVLELHGSILRSYCSACGRPYPADKMNHGEGIPRCSCGGVIRPDIVLYEEPLDDAVVSEAIRVISEAEVLIIGGTSLNVYPAAGLINYYRGNKLALVNLSRTPYDDEADLVINEKIGKVFSQL